MLAVIAAVVSGAGLALAATSTVASRPAMRMGDPWGMIYGGSGWWEQNNPHRTNIGERAASGAREMARWGVQASRVGVCWHDVEKERGRYDWTLPDAVIPAIAEAGIHVVLCVATTPRWAWQHPEVEAVLIDRNQQNLAGCLPHDPKFWPDYERYLTEVVKRYAKHLSHYEIWNEPDGMSGFRFMPGPSAGATSFQHGGDPVWYAELVKRSSRIIKSLQPQARVGIGSFEHKKAMQPFLVDPSLVGVPADGRVTDVLRKAFADRSEASLSPVATVRTDMTGERWIITDDRNGHRYRMIRESAGLKVLNQKTWFIERLYEEGIKGFYDAISVHPYGDPFSREWLAAVRSVMVEQGEGDKPLWVNEYSLHGRGVGLAFSTVRQLRLLRETPWISMAQPLVFGSHLDSEISPSRLSLRAHKRMSLEFGPREFFEADFEGPVLRLLDEWEWDATGEEKVEIDGPELRQELPHAGERCLAAFTPGVRMRVWFSPYVKAPNRRFRGFLLADPADKSAKVSLSVGIESGDILQEVREVRPFMTEVPVGRWVEWDFPIDRQFPDWKDLAVVSAWMEVQSDKPGLSVLVDDVRVGEENKGGR